MERGDQLASEFLRSVRVVNPSVASAVADTAQQYWPGLRGGEVRVGDFRAGVLHVLVDSHARMAEARSFLGEEFRDRLNERLEARREYVTKVVFRVKGTT